MLELFLARVCFIFQAMDSLALVVLQSLRHAPRRHCLKSHPKQKWLFDTRECSLISTIVKPVSAQSFLLHKPFRMCVALSATAGILSALVPLLPLLIKETGFLLSEHRQTSERQELAHKSICPQRDLSAA